MSVTIKYVFQIFFGGVEYRTKGTQLVEKECGIQYSEMLLFP